jgi:large subunit ribosomal protein L21
MWAVIQTGSKQYKVKEGDLIEAQRLKEPVGSKIKLEKVLLFSKGRSLDIGRPYVEGVNIEAEILEEKKDKKVTIFKYKRRKGYKRKRGHRQILATLKILKIEKK